MRMNIKFIRPYLRCPSCGAVMAGATERTCYACVKVHEPIKKKQGRTP